MDFLKKRITIIILLFSLTLSSQETVAILPFVFSDDGHLSIEKGKEAQHFLIDYIHKKSKHINISVLAGRNITVALNKAGITPETIDNFTTKEISDAIGGADYILMGSIDRTYEGTTNYNSNFTTINDKSDSKTNIFSGSGGTTSKTYNATISISIFKGNGTVIYEKSKGNIFIDNSPNSWKNSIIWHVRHFPFYD